MYCTAQDPRSRMSLVATRLIISQHDAMATAIPTVQPTPFPAPSKYASETINSTLITATSISFTDKLLLTLTSSASSGKLSHWVHVALTAGNPLDPASSQSSAQVGSSEPHLALLPRTDLTATTVLGGTKREEEALGQTLAAMLASAILHRRPQEERMLVLGYGLQGIAEEGEESEWFEEVVGLCLQVL